MHRISLSKLMQLIAIIACLFFVLKLVPFLGYSQIPFAAYGFVLALLIEKPNGDSASNIGCRWVATRFLVSTLGMILTIAFFCWASRWTIAKAAAEEELFMFYLPVEIAFVSLSSLIVYAFVFVFIVIPMTQFQMSKEVEAESDSFSNTRKDDLM